MANNVHSPYHMLRKEDSYLFFWHSDCIGHTIIHVHVDLEDRQMATLPPIEDYSMGSSPPPANESCLYGIPIVGFDSFLSVCVVSEATKRVSDVVNFKISWGSMSPVVFLEFPPSAKEKPALCMYTAWGITLQPQ